MAADNAEPDNMNVVHPCAAGLDVHKMPVTTSVRVWKGGGEDGMPPNGSCGHNHTHARRSVADWFLNVVCRVIET